MCDNHPVSSLVLLGTARGTSPTDKGIRIMRITRAFVAGTVATLVISLGTAGSAVAGGDPGYEIGTITVDRIATVDDDLVTLAGSYTCSGAGDRIGSLSFEILMRDGSSTDIQTVSELSCDGAPHRWDSVAVGTGRIDHRFGHLLGQHHRLRVGRWSVPDAAHRPAVHPQARALTLFIRFLGSVPSPGAALQLALDREVDGVCGKEAGVRLREIEGGLRHAKSSCEAQHALTACLGGLHVRLPDLLDRQACALREAAASPGIVLPLLEAVMELLTLVLTSHALLLPQQVRQSEEAAGRVEHRSVQHRLREATSHEHQPGQRLAGRGRPYPDLVQGLEQNRLAARSNSGLKRQEQRCGRPEPGRDGVTHDDQVIESHRFASPDQLTEIDPRVGKIDDCKTADDGDAARMKHSMSDDARPTHAPAVQGPSDMQPLVLLHRVGQRQSVKQGRRQVGESSAGWEHGNEIGRASCRERVL